MMSTPGLVVCGGCDGEGRIFHGHCDDPDAYSEPCPYCAGTGAELIECEPRTLEDMDAE